MLGWACYPKQVWTSHANSNKTLIFINTVTHTLYIKWYGLFLYLFMFFLNIIFHFLLFSCFSDFLFFLFILFLYSFYLNSFFFNFSTRVPLVCAFSHDRHKFYISYDWIFSNKYFARQDLSSLEKTSKHEQWQLSQVRCLYSY